MSNGLGVIVESKQDSGAYTPEARAEERGKLEQDIEAFLKKGGQVAEIPHGERADPPKKPENNYGRGSI